MISTAWCEDLVIFHPKTGMTIRSTTHISRVDAIETRKVSQFCAFLNGWSADQGQGGMVNIVVKPMP